jgi:fibronectin type 3 domain-containing protein/regulation of enolase protein 1 (concanavalin A-like superfamily)
MYLVPQDGNGKVRFAITGCGGNGEQRIVGASALSTGQWVHVAVTQLGPVGTLYVNGNAVGQNLNMTMTPCRLPATTNNWIGRSQFASDPYLNSKVDDFRIYRGALTVGQAYTLATGLAPATPPLAPTNLTVTALAGNQNSLSWTASAGATSYTVLRATTSGGPYTTIATIVPGTTYVDTGLTAGTTYFYEVDGANSGGDGAVSSQSSSVVALPPMPSVPTGFTAFATSSSVVTLTWTGAANAYSYNVKRSLASGGPYTTLATGVTATTFTDSGLTTGTTYYYVVSSVNTAGESANSAQNSATPSDLLVHLRFDETTGATAADSSGNGWNATLVNAPTWTAGVFGNALNFASTSSQYVTLGTGVVGTVNDFTISAWVNVTSFATWARIFDFGTGTTNYMFLSTQGSAGAGKPRFAIRTPSIAEQGINSSVAIPTGTWTQIIVTHTGTTGKMYINGTLVGTNSAMTLTPASLGSTTLNYLGRSQFSGDPYLNGTLDDFRINSHAFTDAEIAAAANPPPNVPTGLATNPSDGLISLNWAISETASTYNVKRAAVSGGPYTTVGSGLTTPTFVDTGLTDGTTYYYVVSAVNWLGESANSAETAATPYSIAWAAQDIGTVAAAGSASVSGPTVTVTGSGADIWGTADAFYFRQVALTGDSVITARVVSVQNTNAWAKAGVMIRGSLAANSMNAALFVTPTTTNGVSWQSRTTNGGSTTNSVTTGITAPYWVRLVRTGATLQGYRSVDGATWVSSGTATLSLGATAYVGLAVSSHADGTLCTATFDNVSVNWVPDAPSSVTATPGPLKVALNWNSVPNATTYNVDVATVSGGPYTSLATGLTSPSYVQTGFTSGATSYYVVTAVNLAGEGFASNEISAAPIYPPAAPGGLTATGGSAQVALSWTASSGATSYNVYRSTTSGGPYGTAIASPTGTSYVDTSAASGVTYYYVVTGVDLAGEGVVSTEINAMTLPGAATGVTASAGNGQVGLNWTAAPGAGTYNVGRSTVSGGPYTTIGSGGTTTSYVDAGLTNGVTYYYVIIGVNASGVGPNSAEASARPLPPIAAAPTGFAAVAGNGQVSLSWNAATYATSYNVKRATTAGGPYTTVASPSGTSAVDSGLTNGTTYYYVVTAVDLAGESANSTEVNAKPLPPIPAVPTGFAAVAGNAQVSLSWSAATYATSYNVKRATTAGGPYTTVASPSGTSAIDTGLTNGTTYYYVVTAVDLAGESGNSAEANAKPLPPIPAVPTGFAAVGGNVQVSLSWTLSTNATSYNVKRATTSGGPYATISSPTGNSYVDTGLANGTTYYYVVTAVDLAGESANSAQASATTTSGLPAVVTGLAAVAYNSEIDLTWSASTGATSYNVLRSTTSGTGYAQIATGVTTTSYVDTGLTNGTTYYYVVTATNAAGTSGNSNQASATPVATPIVDSWLDNDIGSVGQPGSSTYSAGTFTLNGSGAGITGTSDGFDYTYQPLVGDGTVIARVATRSAGESGVMIRETLAANARLVDLLLQQSVGAVFQYRASIGASATTGATVSSVNVPSWVKLARVGNVFTGYTSPDGVIWTQVGTVTATMASSVYVGLAQSSMSYASLAAATFTNVSIVPTSAWSSQDIGTVPIVGASYYSNAVAMINGSGSDIWNKADQFRYTYLPASGDCDITARVTAVTNTNSAAKAGVMIRETLAAGSRHASVLVTPGSGIIFESRSAANGNSTSTKAAGLTAPYWVRIVRSGNTFTAYRSPNGSTWTTIGSQTITMATAVYIGLPVTSHNTSAICTATLDNITATP